MRVLALVLSLVVCTLAARPASACAVAHPQGAQVAIANEEALIVWDAASKTETFIRRMAFRSTTETFGFLVPTPAVPKITEAPDTLFQVLGRLTEPEVRFVKERVFVPSGVVCVLLAKGGKEKSAVTAAAPAVRELQTVNVAGFEAITVEADDPQALAGWLAKHSFAETPELTAWLAGYVEKKWKLTAFVFRADGEERTVGTKAIALTFPSEQPFYPYREPAGGEADSQRLLRVFFASNERYDATMGGKPWRAKVTWSAAVAAADAPVELGAQRRLTVFEDEGTREGVDEVYFARGADQAEVKPAVQVLTDPQEVPIPIDLIVVLVIVIAIVVWRKRRRG